MEGWISLHRKLLHSDIFQNEKLLKVFIYCLLKATHTEHVQKVGRQTVILKPGQFVFGRKQAALELGIKESTIRDYMNLLKNDNTLDIQPTNKFSIVSIVNWGFYQNSKGYPDNKNDNKSDNKKTTEGQQINTNNNGNNVNNENKFNDDDNRHPQVGITNAFQFYEQNGFGTINPYVGEKIGSWIDDLNEELVIHAMKLSIENNAQNWNYVERILKDWSNKKLISLSDVEADQLRFESQRQQKEVRYSANNKQGNYGEPKRPIIPRSSTERSAR